MRRQAFSANGLAARQTRFSTVSLAKRQIAAILWLGAALTGSSFAVSFQSTIVTFDTSGNTAAQSIGTTFNATQQDSGVSGTPQLTRTTLTASGGAAGSFFSNGNLNNTDTFLFNSNYVGYSVTPTAGSVLYATDISFTSQGSSNAPNSYGIVYSTDNFVNTVGSSFYTGTAVTTSVARNFDIPDLITNDTLSVRLSNYGATAIGGGASSATGQFQVISPTVAGSAPSASANIALADSATTEIRTSTTMTLSGVISGNFSVINKTGAGTLILSGQNTLGATNATSIIVNAGTLLGNNNPAGGSFAGAGNIQVNAAGTLGGSGSTGGTVTVAGGGTISPGNGVGSVGNLTLGALTLSDTSNMVFDLAGPGVGDRVTAFGNITLDGKLTVNPMSGFGVGQYPLYNSTGGTVINNTVDVIDAPAGYNYAINISGGTAFLNVTAVPEPTTVLGGALMVGALGWSQRRRVRGWVGNLRFET